MNAQPVVFWSMLTLAGAAAFGWIWNIGKLIALNGYFTGNELEAIFRIIGIFMVPLGVVLGVFLMTHINGKTPVPHGRNLLWITPSQPSTEVLEQSREPFDWSKAAMFVALVAFGLMTGLVGAWVIEDTFTELNFHVLQGCGAC